MSEETNQGTMFVLRLDSATGPGVALEHCYPRERTREYDQTFTRAVESDVGQVFGDGRLKPAPIEIDMRVRTQLNRYQQAKLRATLTAQLARTVFLEFSPMKYAVTSARLVSITPTSTGYSVGLRFYGPAFDFVDNTDGLTVPLI